VEEDDASIEREDCVGGCEEEEGVGRGWALIEEEGGPKGIGGTPFASRVSDCVAAHHSSDSSSLVVVDD
jgi:hypothetical protein